MNAGTPCTCGGPSRKPTPCTRGTGCSRAYKYKPTTAQCPVRCEVSQAGAEEQRRFRLFPLKPVRWTNRLPTTTERK
jgi:hypothetical protein